MDCVNFLNDCYCIPYMHAEIAAATTSAVLMAETESPIISAFNTNATQQQEGIYYM